MTQVLVVDDDPAIRTLIRTILEADGIGVHEAADGAEALTLLRRADSDRQIVLLDYRMPVMDGWELLRIAQADGQLLAQHTFILLTANESTLPPEFLACLEQLNIPILSKPVTLGRLRNMIARVTLASTPHRLDAAPGDVC